jgi:hypothetical protein
MVRRGVSFRHGLARASALPRLDLVEIACYLWLVRVKARDGKIYDVGAAPPLGRHTVSLDGKPIGAFVLEPRETRVFPAAGVGEALLVDIADRFVAQGGAPVGIA